MRPLSPAPITRLTRDCPTNPKTSCVLQGRSKQLQASNGLLPLVSRFAWELLRVRVLLLLPRAADVRICPVVAGFAGVDAADVTGGEHDVPRRHSPQRYPAKHAQGHCELRILLLERR